MALGSFVLLPLVVWPVRTLGKRIRRSTEKIQAGIGELSQILQETVSGNRVVKAFGMEDFEVKKFRESSRHLLRENMRWIRSAVATSPLMDLLGAAVIVLVLMYARIQIKMGAMTAGIFVTFVYALFKSYEPVKGLGTVYQQFEQAHGATAKVFEYIGLVEEPAEEPGVRALLPFSRIVEFDRVSFCYDPGVTHSARSFPAGTRGRSHRYCRFEWSGKDHPGESAAAFLSRHFRRPARGRVGHTRSHVAVPSRTDGHRDAGDDPV